jgi:hypothetical protein
MRWFIIAAVLLVSSSASAQTIMTIPPGEDVIKSLDKGDAAPYRGHLYDTNTAMRWGFWLQQYKLRLKEDVEKERRTCKAELDLKDRKLKIEKDLRVLVVGDLKTRLLRSEKNRLRAEEDMRNPPFWKTFEAGVVFGVVVTVGFGALAVWALGELKGSDG